MKYRKMSSAIGALYLVEENGKLCAVLFDVPSKRFDSAVEKGDSALLQKAERQLQEYFEGRRKTFDLPLELKGTAFQVASWKSLAGIPYGETRTYREQATTIGRPAAVRAVGNANSRNPLSIVLPCHRVIGSQGALTGYAGGLENKKFLLELESRAGR